MNKNNENIDWDIILRKVKGKISDSEEEILQNWMKADPEHQIYYNQAVKFYQKDISELDPDNVPVNTFDFLQKLDRKSKVVRFRKTMLYAAAILLPVSVFLSVWFYQNNSSEKVSFAKNDTTHIIEPIGNKARLITSTGQSVILDTQKGSIKDAPGVEINNDSLVGLKYQQESLLKSQREVYNTLITPKGGEYKLELADGTKVWLNCDSELKYPVAFIGKTRKVTLTGEAFFEVAKNGKPFIIETDDMTMEVLGTRFNISAYKDEGLVQTTLVNGSLKVGTKKTSTTTEKSIVLVPGEQASFDKDHGILDRRKVDVSLYNSWIEGYFRFEGQSMESIMRNIGRWYNIEVNYENQQLKEKRLSGKLYRFDEFNVIAGMIEKISGAKVTVKGNVVSITK